MQDSALTVINFAPGVVKEQTAKVAEGTWIDANKIRFHQGRAELIGGWKNVTTSAQTSNLVGVPRSLETVTFLNNNKGAIIGTHVGLFSSDLTQYNDITPIVTVAPVSNAFSTAAGSREVVVSVSAHGLTAESRIVIAGATATIGGNVVLSPAGVATTYTVSVVNANALKIMAPVTAAATSLLAGSSATVNILYPAGISSNTAVAGYGSGVWSGGFGWSSPPAATTFQNLRVWSLDLYGTNVLTSPTSGPLFLWNTALGITSRATIVTAAPSINQIVRVSPEARHTVLYGTHDVTGAYDPLLIRWSSSEDYTDWFPTLTNTAGDYRLTSRGSEIVAVAHISDKTLIITDSDAFVQTYIGPNDIFGFSRIGENCGIVGPNALTEYNGVAYWMGNNGQFYKYDGRLQSIACPIQRYIFDNIVAGQARKVVAGTNGTFDEIWFFYPTGTVAPETNGGEFIPNFITAENDRYVIYNTVENHWSIGTLSRTAWKEQDTFDFPLGASPDNKGLFYHETGYADDAVALSAHLMSGYFDVADGDEIMFCNKFVPDFSNIANNDIFNNEVLVALYARKYPTDTPTFKGAYTINQNSRYVSTRLRGREFSVELSSIKLNSPWRLGQIRLALKKDGKR